MLGLPKLLFFGLLLICFGSQVDSNTSNHRYNKGDTIPFYANKIGPVSNPRETYAYYDLPLCSPDIVKEEKLNLGEMMNGAHLVSTLYKLEFLVNKDFEILCNKTVNKTDISRFRNVIENDYYVEFYYDDLPIWAFIGGIHNDYKDKRNKNQYRLNKHFDFEVFYNMDRVINIKLRMRIDHDSTEDLIEDKEVEVGFTYSVMWKATSKPFDKRMEIHGGHQILARNLSMHHKSITFSSVTFLILVICLVTFYALVLRKDISKYSLDVEENQEDNNQEETGWKNIHGDVFRFPKHKSLFVAAVGSGTQLLVLVVSILVMGLLGYFPPFVRGVFWNALVIVYSATSAIAGYASVSFYSQLEGTNLMKNLLLAGVLFFGPLFLAFGFLNSVAMFYGTTIALPLKAILIFSLFWIFLGSPLLLLGGIVGKNRGSDFHARCRTAKCAKEIPSLCWYRGVFPRMCLAGILPFSVIYVQLDHIFATVWGYRIYSLTTLCV